MGSAGRTSGALSRRWRATGWDYLVIVGWLAVVAAVAGIARLARLVPDGGNGDERVALVWADIAVFAVTVLPVWAFFTLREAGPWHAGPGKRRVGLRVAVDGALASPVDPAGPRLGRAAGRNAVKWLPWQLAHIAVARAILGVDEWLVMAVTYGLSLVLPILSIGLAWRDPRHRALHDRLAGTVVVPTVPRS